MAGVLLATGSLAFVAGTAIMFTSLAPMFIGSSSADTVSSAIGPPADSATVVAPSAAGAAVHAPPAAGRPSSDAGPIDGLTFEIRVPAVGYQAMVRQGVASNILALGPGHYPGTPWPGQPGNVGVAAHNTYWLSFNRLQPGDRVEIRTQRGLFLYQISGSTVVSPTDRTILAATNDDRLTLTTCYPLWAGAFATQRLIFTAREIGGVA